MPACRDIIGLFLSGDILCEWLISCQHAGWYCHCRAYFVQASKRDLDKKVILLTLKLLFTYRLARPVSRGVSNANMAI